MAPGGTCRAARRQFFNLNHPARFSGLAPGLLYAEYLNCSDRSSGKGRTMKCNKFISVLHQEESGQDLLEYALVLATVLVAIVAGSDAIANVISNALGTVSTRIQTVVQ
jgi:Flp pilus assembly pilin Flp